MARFCMRAVQAFVCLALALLLLGALFSPHQAAWGDDGTVVDDDDTQLFNPCTTPLTPPVLCKNNVADPDVPSDCDAATKDKACDTDTACKCRFYSTKLNCNCGYAPK